MKEEYLPISRKLFEHPLWGEKRVFSYAEVWIDLLRLVRFEANTTKVLSPPIPPGFFFDQRSDVIR